MKTDDIENLCIIPEDYDYAYSDNSDGIIQRSEMNETERKFISGLIRYYCPENIIELGVSYGSGTVTILNAIIDKPGANLVSIDKLDYYYKDISVPVGSAVYETFPNLEETKWRLISGRDPSIVLGDLARVFDFAVIDTSHAHPIESLNFLCLLPYLNDGAIVIIHDISLFLFCNSIDNAPNQSFAPRILASSVVGGKLTPRKKTTFYVSETEPVNNIIAVQVTSETRKYICNLFMSLLLPWEIFPYDDIKSIRSCIARHYSTKFVEQFDEAVRMNLAWVSSNKMTFSMSLYERILCELPGNTVFYGAGTNMVKIIEIFNTLNIPFEFEIWDINADKISAIKGHRICFPNNDNIVNESRTMVITLSNKGTISGIAENYRSLGWNVVNGLNQVVREMIIANCEHD